MKFRYVIHTGRKFFHIRFQGSYSKNNRFIEGKPFSHCFRSLNIHNSASEAQKCTKIGEIFFNYLSKDPESFIKLSQKHRRY